MSKISGLQLGKEFRAHGEAGSCLEPLLLTDMSRNPPNAHSKLQKPPHMPAPESGAETAATNTQRQERTAADVPRACSSSCPRRLGRICTNLKIFNALSG